MLRIIKNDESPFKAWDYEEIESDFPKGWKLWGLMALLLIATLIWLIATVWGKI